MPRRTALLVLCLALFASACVEVRDQTAGYFYHGEDNVQTLTAEVDAMVRPSEVKALVAGGPNVVMTHEGGDRWSAEVDLPDCTEVAHYKVRVTTDVARVFPEVGTYTRWILEQPDDCPPTPGPRVFEVDSTSDAEDDAPGDGLCEGLEGCTLRAAVMEANAWPGADLIRLPGGRYTVGLTGSESGEGLDDAVGDLDLTDDVTIDGFQSPGAKVTSFLTPDLRDDPDVSVVAKIDADGIDRGIQVAPDTTVRLRNLAIVNGRPDGPGGGILNDGRLGLERVTVASNGVLGVDAFAIGGGAIHNAGTLVGDDVALTQNRAGDGTQNPSGGALFNEGTATLRRTLMAYNDARFGSAIRNNSEASLDLVNSSIVGNDGGISHPVTRVVQNSGDLRLHLVTVNSHSLDPGASALYTAAGGTTRMTASLMTQNFPIPCDGPISSGGANVIEDSCPGLSGAPASAPDAVDVGQVHAFSGLSDEGGYTPVVALVDPSWESTAFQVVDYGPAVTTGGFSDQRRIGPRNADGDGDGVRRLDPGAFEYQP